jgi:hypothetical protein
MEAQEKRHKNKSDTPTTAQNDLLCAIFPRQFAIVQWQWCSPSHAFLILLFKNFSYNKLPNVYPSTCSHLAVPLPC